MEMRLKRLFFQAVLLLCVAPLSLAKAAEKPTGFDPAGQMVVVSACGSGQETFSWTELHNGIQFCIGRTVKNVLFYGPRIVRVNANLGDYIAAQQAVYDADQTTMP